MKNTFERKLIEPVAAASVIAFAAYALFSGSCYAQQTIPSITAVADGKETKEVEKLVEQPKPTKPLFNLYGWTINGHWGSMQFWNSSLRADSQINLDLPLVTLR